MKPFKIISSIICIYLLAVSCRKVPVLSPVSSLNVVNAVVGSGPLLTNFTQGAFVNSYYAGAAAISYGSCAYFSRPSGANYLIAYQTTDTLHAIFETPNSAKMMLAPEAHYTLWLCGELKPGTQAEAFYTLDKAPAHPASDSMGIRFIDLSPGSAAVNVSVAGNPADEFSGLVFKSVTAFKNYAVTLTGGYTFRFRDAATGAVLATFTINAQSAKNYTLVLTGLPNSQTAFTVDQ